MFVFLVDHVAGLVKDILPNGAGMLVETSEGEARLPKTNSREAYRRDLKCTRIRLMTSKYIPSTLKTPFGGLSIDGLTFHSLSFFILERNLTLCPVPFVEKQTRAILAMDIGQDKKYGLINKMPWCVADHC